MTRNRYMVVLVFMTFFVMSLVTNILGPIVPDIISSYRVTLTAAGFLAFAFFIAYGVMSIPAGFLVERFAEKPVMIFAFLAATMGSLSFALLPTYRVAVVSLFERPQSKRLACNPNRSTLRRSFSNATGLGSKANVFTL